MGATATVGGRGVQYCPFRARTAHAAGGVIRDCLDAAHHCRSAARALTKRSHLAATRTDCYAARRCRSAARALTQRSHLAATRTDCYATHRCRSAAHRCRSAARALTQRSHLSADRTVWYAARCCRSAARALTQRSHPSLEAACHCRYTACSSHLAATTAAIVITAVRALTQRSHLAAARTGCYAARCCRSAACALAQRSNTACCMFADAGVVSIFHRGRRLDDIVIAITGGDTGPADVQKETAAAGRRTIFFAAHPPCNENAGQEGRRARAGKDQVGGPSAFRRAGRSDLYAAAGGDVVRPRGRTSISCGGGCATVAAGQPGGPERETSAPAGARIW